jgi:hypothetical protein
MCAAPELAVSLIGRGVNASFSAVSRDAAWTLAVGTSTGILGLQQRMPFGKIFGRRPWRI